MPIGIHKDDHLLSLSRYRQVRGEGLAINDIVHKSTARPCGLFDPEEI